ncbi:unnamed protein product, partial [Polarella glacialis]
ALLPQKDNVVHISQGISQDGLSYQLAYKNEQEKAVAIIELAAKGEDAVVSHLDAIVAHLRQHRSREIKHAVCKAVVAAGPAAARFYEDIVQLIDDQSDEVRYWCCLALGAIGSSAIGAKSRLRLLLEDSSEAVRFGACSALGALQATDCVEDLKKMLTDKSPEVQGAACLALGKLGDGGKPCAALVAQKLSQPRSRLSALKALSLMAEEGAKYCEAVCECLADEDAETRVAAASVVGKLAEFAQTSPMPRVLDLVKSEDGRTRSAAVLALGYMGKEAAEHKDLIKDMLNDSFEESAENALTIGGARPRLPPSCRKAKCAAAAALGRIAAEDDRGFGWEPLASDLTRLLSDADWEVRLCALDALAALGGRARPNAAKVASQFTDEKYVIRSKAARAYGKLGSSEHISALASLLEDSCPSVKADAATALAELGVDGADFNDKVFELVQDFAPEVRAAAITALSRMGEKGQYYASSIAQRVDDREDPAVRVAVSTHDTIIVATLIQPVLVIDCLSASDVAIVATSAVSVILVPCLWRRESAASQLPMTDFTSLPALIRQKPGLLSVLTAEARAELEEASCRPEAPEQSRAWDQDLARLVLRSKVWSVRRKWELLGSYSPEQSEAVLASFQLPAAVAAQCGLPEHDGFTWLDAVQELKKASAGETPVQLWQRVENHPMVQYVPAQCQDCGRHIKDTYPAPEDPDLVEEEPTEEERPFVRSGWFRGPRGPVVFVYRCRDCGQTTRWFRSLHPEVTLNPRRWGRLCGEQEDLKAWLARYLGVRLRVCCPLDWDHVWTEVWDGTAWKPLDPNCLNFARRLQEGIGSWTRVLAIGTPGSGKDAADAGEASEEVTEAYFARAGGSPEELRNWRATVDAARADASGASTQSRTLCGHVLQVARFDDLRITQELRSAQADFDLGRKLCELRQS